MRDERMKRSFKNILMILAIIILVIFTYLTINYTKNNIKSNNINNNQQTNNMQAPPAKPDDVSSNNDLSKPTI